MRTQSNVEAEVRPPSASGTATEPGADTMSFRASSLDEAVALAEESLGAPVRVVSASRIRRGGIGGFFASDLGVEVNVALDDETIEQALERLVAETAADERTRWLEHRVVDTPTARTAAVHAAPVHTAPGPPAPLASLAVPAAAAPPVPASLFAPAASSAAGTSALAAPRRSALGTPKPVEAAKVVVHRDADLMTAESLKIPDAVARIAQRDEEPSMVRVEEILEELQILTRPQTQAPTDGAATQFAPPAPPVQRTVALPRLPPRPIDIARAASANAAVSQAVAVEVERARDATTVEVDVDVPADAAAEPSQRQVELAVAATDQLIESLQRDGVKRLSVRVVLRTGDQSAVEAEAQWESA